MTTREHDDLHDARVDAAWRAASREEPPRALDDALRAAARREIGAGPRAHEPRSSSVPQSLRPERWWWPLAAAATIGAVAIGLLQLVEPEHVTTPAASKDVVSDAPAGAVPLKKQEAPATPAAASPTPAPAPEQESQPKPSVPTQAPAPASTVTPAPASTPAPAKTLRKDVATPFPREEDPRRAASMSSAQPAKRESAGAPASPPPPAAEPFPADKVESKETAKRDSAPAPMGRAAASAADATVPGSASGKLEAAPTRPAESEEPREAQRAVPYAAQESKARRAQVDSGERTNAPAPAFAQSNRLAAPRAKVAPKLPVSDWIALIRKLRDEGKTDEAAKELAAFRQTYVDPEPLLPPDLRDWKPAQ